MEYLRKTYLTNCFSAQGLKFAMSLAWRQVWQAGINEKCDCYNVQISVFESSKAQNIINKEIFTQFFSGITPAHT